MGLRLVKRLELISIRVKRETKDLVEEVCEARGEDVSSFLRRALFRELGRLGYLDEKQMRALGMSPAAAEN